jgi:hypothetical protein
MNMSFVQLLIIPVVLHPSNSMDYRAELQRYLDEQGRVKEWPSKRNRKYQKLVLEYLALKFEVGVTYTEKEVNTLLNQHHSFGDAALLRRELFENKLIDRKRDGSAYWCDAEGNGLSRIANLKIDETNRLANVQPQLWSE